MTADTIAGRSSGYFTLWLCLACGHGEAVRGSEAHAPIEEATREEALDEGEAIDACGRAVDAPPMTSQGAVAALGNHLYWVGGSYGAPSTLARRFDVRTRRWETLPQPQFSRVNPALVADESGLVLVGGLHTIGLSRAEIERFDPIRCRWRHVGRLPWAPNAPSVASIGNRVFIAGGGVALTRSREELEFWNASDAAMLDGEDRLHPLPPTPTPRAHAGAVIVGDALWIIGGRVHRRGDVYEGRDTDVVEVLTPDRRWETGPRLPDYAEVFAVALADGTIVAFGRSVTFTRRPMILVPGADEWQRMAPRDPRIEFLEGAALIDGVIYVLAHRIERHPQAATLYVATYEPRRDEWNVVSEIIEE
jgi:hypothetical protein